MDTSANTITTMGIVSNEVYADNGQKYFTDNPGTLVANGTEYEVIDHTSDSSLNGFQALLLKSGTQYVIAFRGTDSLVDGIIDITALPLANYNPQYNSAVEFVNNAIQTYGIDKSSLTLTGHSLGGILTQQVGASLGIKGYAYNPWGADALTKYPPNGPLNIVARVLEAVGIYTSSAEAFAKDNIANISYQDGGDLNGDFLSNLLTGAISEHLGDAFIPIWGADIEADGHRMPILNSAIAHYNEVLTHFSNSNYEELSLAYLSKGSFEKTEQVFNDVGVYQASGLSFTFLTDTPAPTIANEAKTNTATLYALVHLNPFTIQGDLQAYKTLKVDDYSDMYMQKRSEMLYYTIKPKSETSGKAIYYKDVATNIETYTRQSGVVYTSKVLFGKETDDNETVLNGSSGDDFIFGMNGNDALEGNTGNDYLEGGKGVDSLRGGAGNDTYYFQRGDFLDTVYDKSGDDTLLFGKNITKDDLIVQYDGNDLIITLKDSSQSDSITLKDWYTKENRIEYFEFADGTLLDEENILDLMTTPEADSIQGTENDNTLEGTEGDDILIGNKGNDTLEGGEGNDLLMGGDGYDTYIVDAGDTVIDSDGKGRVIFQGNLLSGASMELGETHYYSQEDHGTYF
ncbi:MAG: DUF2974 domain-containing protein [Campylobacterales bacterium]|nr:DUF2974 domain-containing protein [Campylobacterales bacterium]